MDDLRIEKELNKEYTMNDIEIYGCQQIIITAF